MLLYWQGNPVGFMTHTEDRIQSSITTKLHVVLANFLGVNVITIASADEAFLEDLFQFLLVLIL